MEIELPSAFTAADDQSSWGQRVHLRLTKIELALVVLGACAGLLEHVGKSDINMPQLFGGVLFVGALLLRAHRSSEQYERQWFEGRAAAESIKSLAWRYAVGGKPTGLELQSAEADGVLVGLLREIVTGRPRAIVRHRELPAAQITAWMRRTRELPLDERAHIYRTSRIEDQRAWYAARAFSNAQQHRRWNFVVLALEFLGFVVGLSQAVGLFGSFRVGALGVAGAVVAAVISWSHAKQFGTLASAYAQAELELSSLLDLFFTGSNENEWASFVESAETAISREHRMWQSARSLA
ncbi:MAG: DUF4231 domain-containing protein [Actinomycetia bacterium]|nr:DUF4231 domain-containing protein [Actinomycetes bacterium]